MNIKKKPYKTYSINPITTLSEMASKEDGLASINDAKSYIAALQQLDTKIDQQIKQITYYDIMKFSQIVSRSDEFDEKVAQLLPNEALIINSDSFQIDSDEYARGDIVVLDNNQVQHHIKAQAAGYFYPSKLEKKVDGSFNLTFTYAENLPDGGTQTISPNTGVWQTNGPSNTIAFSGLVDEASQNIYGNEVSTDAPVESPHITLDKVGNTYTLTIPSYSATDKADIMPFVKIYDEGDNEEIITDIRITPPSDTNSNWVFVFNAIGTIKCVVK